MASGYDYIVIGAGSAGAVVANRLSATGASALLLEAGGKGNERNIRIPAFIDTLLDTSVDWGYRTTAQPELNGRRIFLSRGKCLGGTSAINAMVYMRGNRGDYDHWRSLGNRGWGYEDLLPYFKRSEGNRGLNDPWHGTEGPLAVSSYDGQNPIHRAFIEAGHANGLPYNPDFNGQDQFGCGPFQATIGPMGRCSTKVAFLDPAMDRPNLTVTIHAQVTRILIKGGRATGVSFLHMGREETATANAEVILCGGAINSPQLLMLSGIGPADHLRAMGISVELDLPGVGQDLQDHLQVPVRFSVTEPATVFGLSAEQSEAAINASLEKGSGPYHSNMCESGAFLRCDPAEQWPDVQIHCENAFSAYYYDGTPADRHGFALWLNMCRPRSRGEVRLASADPLDRPLIDPRYLSNSYDLDISLKALKTCIEIGTSPQMAPLGTAYQQPGPGIETDADLIAYIRRNATTIWHPTSTCRMGLDPMAVVDDQLRVQGIDGLRIADASVMPTVTSGNTNAPCIMIGEKAADMILGNPAPTLS
ncbi:MAG: hypothetical protein DI533_06460 [Cereibacter sphaeroides]|uniref:Glucose-methanol-choline oxidoreductase N-terminal domain-containing protein n=1 Tax=Cereibacter sphaeroides TaxID=1063 RepID=A0A2W5TVV8_CERSP|nr:MAG: hypothetical protein DI533_06460 [Cereibacter sphaeroides]